MIALSHTAGLLTRGSLRAFRLPRTCRPQWLAGKPLAAYSRGGGRGLGCRCSVHPHPIPVWVRALCTGRTPWSFHLARTLALRQGWKRRAAGDPRQL